jgi:hypothetical protein|tara:strand:+ start:60 stop:353 length:294 start_codon:yes stop_codon:yes gene_type:complete
MKEMKNMAYWKSKAGINLTKKPVGPVADKKEIKDNDSTPLSPGYEDPIKIQKLQREGLIPGSQTFIKKKKYPKSYTKEDIKFLEDQREDVVREEDKK